MSGQISVVGHRGWPERFPDNTLSGFLAAALICDAIELDVRRSADGKLVLSHDATMGGLDVHATPWSVLSELDVGGGHRPCLLDETMAALPGTPVFIEIKNTPGMPGYEPDSRLALEAAARARPADVLISFNWASIDLVRARFPDVATGLSLGVFGDLDEASRHCFDAGHAYLVPDAALLKRANLDFLPDLDVFVWSPNREETFEDSLDELVSLGVSGIITDAPGIARAVLGSRR
jgi:glycerophosphoryl diester phosphodiesterase